MFRCVCVSNVIQKCFDEGNYSLVEIVDKIDKYSFFLMKKEHAKLGEAVCDGVIVNFIKEKRTF